MPDIAPLAIPYQMPRVQYSLGPSPLMSFAIPWKFWSVTSDLAAVIVDSTGAEYNLVYGLDFTVVGNVPTDPNQSYFDGGTVTLLATWPSTTLTLWRLPILTRQHDISPTGPLDVRTLNAQLDQLFTALQDEDLKVNSAYRVPYEQLGNSFPNLEMPFPVEGQVLGWHAGLLTNIPLSGGGGGGGGVDGPITVPGYPTTRPISDHFADNVYAKDFGAVFDGNSHPLSNYYTTLGAAQAVYPKATALNNEMDGIAVQTALDFCAARTLSGGEFSFGGTVILPSGKGLMNTPLTINNSCVSLRSQGNGFYLRPSVTSLVGSAPCKLIWTGPALLTTNATIYMLTIAPTDGGRRLAGCNVEGVMFDCQTVTGISGILIMSLINSRINVAVKEARGVPYAASLTSGSQNITVSSTANIHQGESISSPSLTPGAYVASIVNSTTIQASAQASATSSETLVIGGECIRFDCVSGLADNNDVQLNEVWITYDQEQGAAYSFGPCVVIGGSSSGAMGGTAWGNCGLNQFQSIRGSAKHGVGIALNNSDHNLFRYIGFNALGGDGIGLVSNGTLDPHNGSARNNVFTYVNGTCYFKGTNTGGFTSASTFNQINFLDKANGGTISEVGTGTTLAVDTDSNRTLRIPYNYNLALVPYPGDSTNMGGNFRGNYAVDLQFSTRTDPSQVASGLQSVLAGGQQNTASGQQSVVCGGNVNVASGFISAIPGGQANVASTAYTTAIGYGATADLMGQFALSSGGRIQPSRQSQYSVQVLRALTATNTTPVRLTADGAAASATNTVNQTSPTSQANNLFIQLIALDTFNSANRYSWTQNGLLVRTTSAVANTIYTPGTPTILTGGTTAGIAITEAADTTLGAYSLIFTPPTGNVAQWRIVATVQFTRVDGA